MRELVAQLNAYLLPLSPLEFQFQMTVEQMAEPDDDPVRRPRRGGPGGRHAARSRSWRRHRRGEAHVSRVPEVRGQRSASALLERDRGAGAREGHRAPGARDRRRRRASSRRWTASTSTAASRPAAPFLDYPDSDWSASSKVASLPSKRLRCCESPAMTERFTPTRPRPT